MTFLAAKTHPNGATSAIHKIDRLEIVGDVVRAIVNSYATDEMYSANIPMIIWQDTYLLPIESATSADAWMIGLDGPFAGGTLRPDAAYVPSLEDAKNSKNNYINQSRLKANQSSFTFADKQVAVDPLSRSDIDAVLGIVTLTNEMPIGWVGAWKTIDNSYVAIPDKATWTLFYTAMVAQGSVNFAHSQDLKTQLAAATTIEEVEAIVW